MKKCALLIYLYLYLCMSVFLTSCVGVTNSLQDPGEKTNPAKKMAEEKQIQTLGIYQKNYDQAKNKTASSSQLAPIISAWGELANMYVPAKIALLKRRDDINDAVLNAKGKVEDFHLLVLINEAIFHNMDTYALFIQLHNSQPKQALNFSPELIKHLAKQQACLSSSNPQLFSAATNHNQMRGADFGRGVTNPPVMATRYHRESGSQTENDICSLVVSLAQQQVNSGAAKTTTNLECSAQ